MHIGIAEERNHEIGMREILSIGCDTAKDNLIFVSNILVSLGWKSK